MSRHLFACTCLLMPMLCSGAEADITAVKVEKSSNGTYGFRVSVAHQDSGWDHYADKWDVVGPDGQVLATRTLYHPHVNEQPFTRSLSGISIPPGVKQVTLRAHDSVHAYGGKILKVDLP